MAESMQPDPADTLSSSETPIDVVRTASEDHYVHPIISDDGQDGKQDTQKPSPASPKKKHIENVWISQAAYGELQGFGIGTPPSIGLIHGTMAGQGMVLINRFSAIPRDLGALCQWKVSALPGDVHSDAIGFIIFILPYMPIGLEAPLGIIVQRFHNEAGHLVMKSNCVLYSPDFTTKLRSINFFKLASCEPLSRLNDTSDYIELNEVRQMLPAPISRLQSKLYQTQAHQRSLVAKELFDCNNSSYLDRVLLELRRNINQRVLELERAATSKRQKSSQGDHSESIGFEDSKKFRNHIIQLAQKEFVQMNDAIAKRPVPLVGPDYTSTILTKTAKIQAASVVKRKTQKPAAKPASSTS